MVCQEQSNPRQSHKNLHTAGSFPRSAGCAQTLPGRDGGAGNGQERWVGNWDSKEADITGDKLS